MSQSIPLSPGPGGASQEGSTVTITRAVFTQGRPILTDGSSLITTETLVNGLPVAATATPKAGPGDAGTDGKGGQETDGDAEKQPDLTAVPAELPTTFDIEANATKEAVSGSQPLPTPNPGDIDGDPAPSGLSGNGTEAASPDSTAANSKKTPVGAIAGGVVSCWACWACLAYTFWQCTDVAGRRDLGFGRPARAAVPVPQEEKTTTAGRP